MKKLLIFLICICGFIQLKAQNEPTGLTADFGFIRFGNFNSTSQGFSTSNIGAYYNPRFVNRKIEMGINTIVVKDYLNDKFENHFGL